VFHHLSLLFFFRRAFFLRARPEAFPALLAISRRFSALKDLARARPPRLPISLESMDGIIVLNLTLSCQVQLMIVSSTHVQSAGGKNI
jgi:hypothetical protein